MSEEDSKTSILSNKAVDLLKRLDDSFTKLDDDPPHLTFSFQNVQSNEYKNQLTWIIKKADLDKVKNGNILKSPNVEIHFLNANKFWLQIHPKHSDGDLSQLDISVCFDELPENVFVQCNITLKNHNQQDVWEETYSGSSCDIKERKIQFLNLFLGVGRRNDLSLEEKLQIDCRIKLVANIYRCSGLQNYVVNETPKINNYMEDILNSGKYSDIDLAVESSSIKAHKCILAMESPSLRVLFKVNYGKEQELQNEKFAIFKDVMSYIYTGDIRINHFQHAWELYNTADKYELLNLKNLCSAYLNANLTETTISDVFDLSRDHHDEYLFKACLDFIKQNDIDLSTKLFLDSKFRKSK